MEARARKEAPSVGRRRFVLWLGGAGLLPLATSLGSILGLSLGAADSGAQAGGGAAKPGATPAPPPATPPGATPPGAMSPNEPPKISDEARALHGILMARYGKDLDATQSQGLLEAVEGGVGSGKALRAKKLANSIEPGSAFAATPMPAASGSAAAKGGR
jgi:hypothetical protein